MEKACSLSYPSARCRRDCRLLTRDGMRLFETVEKPPLSPPGWLFPVAWTILYLMMGAASYLVLVSEKSGRTALTVYGIQLLVNFFWPVFFLIWNCFSLPFSGWYSYGY